MTAFAVPLCGGRRRGILLSACWRLLAMMRAWAVVGHWAWAVVAWHWRPGYGTYGLERARVHVQMGADRYMAGSAQSLRDCGIKHR